MSLKVFNLQCDTGHLFEGWFGSHDDYDAQKARGLITCPMCQSAQIQKMPSAPRINSSRTLGSSEHAQSPDSSVVAESVSMPVTHAAELAKLQAAVLAKMREVVNSAENVGAAFAREARAMHEGESKARSIRGTATPEERQELAEEGIAVMTLPDFLSDDRLQ
ncbi:DUF1178 family protein [Orrella daihaiensis]|uniref:DUF1178 family protein n=1 Tax=Orrella daihaiensis TaxID=2782176 RepID=A0ABY4AHA5_9BURK|nr:DUF1178 family protein [Orrella daihaiensis]UOD49666.1 DUF1178 family protein [Orrella daihaiensis]